jgi:hypothetical protein
MIFVAPPIGIVATPLAAIWVVCAFMFKVLGWGFRGGKWRPFCYAPPVGTALKPRVTAGTESSMGKRSADELPT